MQWNLLHSSRATSFQRRQHRLVAVPCRMAPSERRSTLRGLRAPVRVSTTTSLWHSHQLPRGRRDGVTLVLLWSRQAGRMLGGATSFDWRPRVSRPSLGPATRLRRLPASPACVDCLRRLPAPTACAACLRRPPGLPACVARLRYLPAPLACAARLRVAGHVGHLQNAGLPRAGG